MTPGNITKRSSGSLSSVSRSRPPADTNRNVLHQEQSFQRASDSLESDNGDESREMCPSRDDIWDEMFQTLKEYGKTNGSLNVLNKKGKLANWIYSQRAAYRRLLEGSPCSLTPERLAKLQSIGFEFSSNNYEAWHLMFEKYKLMLDNQITDQAEARKVSTWVMNQRLDYSRMKRGLPSKTTSYKIKKLNSMGFDWSVGSRRSKTWESTFRDYQAEWAQDPTLNSASKRVKNWVSMQRTEYHRLQQGLPSFLTKERIKKLESVDFIWSMGQSWDSMFSAYKEAAETAPELLTSDARLRTWALKQRTEYAKLARCQPTRLLTQDRVEKLNGINFDWNFDGEHTSEKCEEESDNDTSTNGGNVQSKESHLPNQMDKISRDRKDMPQDEKRVSTQTGTRFAVEPTDATPPTITTTTALPVPLAESPLNPLLVDPNLPLSIERAELLLNACAAGYPLPGVQPWASALAGGTAPFPSFPSQPLLGVNILGHPFHQHFSAALIAPPNPYLYITALENEHARLGAPKPSMLQAIELLRLTAGNPNWSTVAASRIHNDFSNDILQALTSSINLPLQQLQGSFTL